MIVHGHWCGGKSSGTYNTWQKMKARCDDPQNNMYMYYGGRGLTYQKAWKEFTEFLQDMGERPVGMTLDRIDNAKGYSKDNCRWATKQDQARNKSLQTRNISGCTGVTKRESGSWRASIRVEGVLVYLGTFLNLHDAIKARKDAELYYDWMP